MRVFVTSYQKSGTHQIMPAMGIRDDIVDRSYIDMQNIEDYIPFTQGEFTIEDTCKDLREFLGKKFGHLPYHPKYAEAVQARATRVLFNVRDPRDVVVANYHSIQKICNPKNKPMYSKGLGHLNFMNKINGKILIEQDDPIAELIKIEAKRWPAWLGWLEHDWTMMVKYEDLRLNPQETIEKIAEFVKPFIINVPLVVGNLKPRPTNPTFRKGAVGDWKNEFSEYHKELSQRLMKDTIERLGYEL